MVVSNSSRKTVAAPALGSKSPLASPSVSQNPPKALQHQLDQSRTNSLLAGAASGESGPRSCMMMLSVLASKLSGVQLAELRLGLLQIERVEAFSEPVIDRGKKIAGPPKIACR